MRGGVGSAQCGSWWQHGTSCTLLLELRLPNRMYIILGRGESVVDPSFSIFLLARGFLLNRRTWRVSWCVVVSRAGSLPSLCYYNDKTKWKYSKNPSFLNCLFWIDRYKPKRRTTYKKWCGMAFTSMEGLRQGLYQNTSRDTHADKLNRTEPDWTNWLPEPKDYRNPERFRSVLVPGAHR